MKKIVGIFIVLLILSSITLSSTSSQTSHGTIIIVDDEGDGDFTKIREAISYAQSGDTIYVYSGTYEELVDLNKPIILIGISEELENGSDFGKPLIFYQVRVFSDECTFSGFGISSNNNFLIGIYSNMNIITNNHLDCRSNNVEYGILLENVDNNLINQNKITGNAQRGIYIFNSNQNRVCNNSLIGPGWPLSIQLCKNTLISNNTIFSYSGRRGMFLYNSISTNFSYNYLKGAHWGISMYGDGCQDTIISHNIFIDNSWTILIDQCENTLIQNNLFQDNLNAIVLDCTHDTFVERNNFINSMYEDAYVCWPLWFPLTKPPKNNIFDSNYWDNIGSMDKKRIPIRLSIYDAMFPSQIPYSFTYDVNPAEEPYDIP
jgi:parallel beta-helix repeat protein